MTGDVARAIGELEDLHAASDGRGFTEAEALRIVSFLGCDVPRTSVLAAADEAANLDLSGFPGDRVVVKATAPGLAHKTDVGGVCIVPKTPAEVGAAARAVAGAFPGPGSPGILVAEYVPHDPGPGGELLIGMRWTDDFGPVVTTAPGGIHAEVLAEALGAASIGVFAPGTGPAAAVGAWPFPRDRRGRVDAAPEALAAVVAVFLEFAAAAMPRLVEEFEVNPLVFVDGRPVALDAVIRPGPATEMPRRPARPLAKLDRMLRPGSIAVVGVSSGSNPGRAILENILAAGYPREAVTVVKPGVAEIAGCRCVPDLDALPGPVDLAVLSVGADRVPDLMERIVDGARAEAVVVIPGGLGETEAGAAPARRIEAAIARSREMPGGGPVVVGPNSLGIRSVPGRYDAFFTPPPGERGEAAPAALISQSGAFLLSRLDRLPWLRPRFEASIGNQLDLTAGDFLGYFADDPAVSVVGCYLEGFRPGDGRRWLDAARALTDRGGTVVLYRAGRRVEGVASAASHTAVVAGDHRVTEGLASAAGVLVATTLEEFEDLLKLAVLLRDASVSGLRLGAASNAGFECVAIADALGPFRLARFVPETTDRLRAVFDAAGIGAIAVAGNPADLTPAAVDGVVIAAADALLADPGVDVGLVGIVPFTPAVDTTADGALADGLLELRAGTSKAWAVVIDGDRTPLVRRLEAGGIPVFPRADRAVVALGRYCAWRRSRANRTASDG